MPSFIVLSTIFLWEIMPQSWLLTKPVLGKKIFPFPSISSIKLGSLERSGKKKSWSKISKCTFLHFTVSRFIQIKKKSYAEIILTNEIPPRCDIPSRRVTIMSSRRVITSWRHTFLDAISHCNFNFVGRDMMTGWHIITRRDGILHQGGISLGCNMSIWQKNDKYRPSTDC